MKQKSLLRSLALLRGLAALAAMCASAAANPGGSAQNSDFSDTTTWMRHVGGSGVELTPAGNGFAVDYAAGAQPDANDNIYAGYCSTFALRGDFTLDIDYTLKTWPAESGVRLGLSIRPFVGVLREGTADGGKMHGGELYTFIAGPFVTVPTSDQQGTLRLVRNGGTLLGYYRSSAGGPWVLAGSRSGDPVFLEDLQVLVQSWSHRSSFGRRPVAITLGNFVMTADTVLPGPYGIPAWAKAPPLPGPAQSQMVAPTKLWPPSRWLATTVMPVSQPALVNINIAATNPIAVGFAATGLSANDYWNGFTAPWQSFAGLSNLRAADGTPTAIGMTVQNGAGNWYFNYPGVDVMYSTYCYAQDLGKVTVTLTNLPGGQYDLYLYGHGGADNANTVFELRVGGAHYGLQSTATNSDWSLRQWVEGAQYVVYRSVAVTNGGAPVTIIAHPGLSKYTHVNGLQIARSAPPPEPAAPPEKSRAKRSNFADTTTWIRHVVGSGVQPTPAGNGFAVDYAAGAQPDANDNIYAGYCSTFALRGDFTLDIDYTLKTWPAESGVRLGLTIWPSVGMLRVGTVEGGEYYSFIAGPFVNIPTSDQQGTLRLVRTGGTLLGYYRSSAGGPWVLAGSRSENPVFLQDLQVFVGSWAHGASFGGRPVTIALGNFMMAADTVLPGPYGIPAWTTSPPAPPVAWPGRSPALFKQFNVPAAPSPAGIQPLESTALPSGILEEDLNLDLNAAIQSYQSLISQFDAQRPLAANAVFRSAECYRRLGKLDEARAQYNRILREFSDQAPLASLSRKYASNVTATAIAPRPAVGVAPEPRPAEGTATLEWQLAQARSELLKARNELAKAQAMLAAGEARLGENVASPQATLAVNRAQADVELGKTQVVHWSREVARLEDRLKGQDQRQRGEDAVARLKYQQAEAQFKRAKALFDDHATSAQDYDAAKLALAEAAAQYPGAGDNPLDRGEGGGGLRIIPWGKVIDPDGDCDLSFEGGKLKVSIPGKVHGLSVERGNMSAPRVLQEVNGDFVAQVKVSGAFAPGTSSSVSGRRAFQGAGLVLWQDAKNYIRLERAQLVVEQETMSYASFELRRDGQLQKSANAAQHPLAGKATVLRLERHGDKISASVSPDGVQWTALEPMVVKLSKTVRIGVVAGHNTSTPLTAEFEGFKLTPAAEAPATSF